MIINIELYPEGDIVLIHTVCWALRLGTPNHLHIILFCLSLYFAVRASDFKMCYDSANILAFIVLQLSYTLVQSSDHRRAK